ncbi:MAG: hypothetical protein AAF828_12070 [Bacteroidota bacterium]
MKKYSLFYLLLLSASLAGQVNASITDEIAISKDYEVILNEPKPGELTAVLIKEINTEKVVDSLLLIDGQIKIIDYLINDIDSVSIIFESAYPSLGKRVVSYLFLYDANTGLYSGRSIELFSFTPPPYGYQSDTNKSNPFRSIVPDEFFCKDFTIIDHNTIEIERKEKLNATNYIVVQYDLVDDVDDLTKEHLGLMLKLFEK